MAQKVVLDLDPGIDDALALLLALASPELEVRAVTVASGNCPAAQGTANTLAVLELACRSDIPVARGALSPLLRPPFTAPETHGPTGLGHAALPPPQRPPSDRHATDLLIATLREAPGEVTLVATAPLTNLALAVRLEPRLPQLVRQVIIMGGALRVPGNVTPVAEFNFFVDPHAAQIVLHAGLPVTLVGLDVTTQALLTPELVAGLQAIPSPITRFVADATGFYMRFHQEHQGVVGCHIHDALALALAFAPDLVRTQEAYVDVEVCSELTMGQSVADFGGWRGEPPNVKAAVEVDAPRFLKLFVERIGQLAAAVP